MGWGGGRDTAACVPRIKINSNYVWNSNDKERGRWEEGWTDESIARELGIMTGGRDTRCFLFGARIIKKKKK